MLVQVIQYLGSTLNMLTRKLMLVRHAKSSWSDNSLNDFERPLNKRGANDAERVARWIATNKFIPETLLCSPARRARQTAEAILKVTKMSDETVRYIPKMYLADTDVLLQLIHETDNRMQSIMLIGHNPGLEHLLEWVSSDALPYTKDGKLLTTANFVMLGFDQDWQTISDHQGQLLEFMRPKQLV